MPCLFILLALFVPRLVIIVLWLFTHWFAGIFDNVLWPILGFLFLPTTLLWYTAVFNWFDAVFGPWQVVGLVVAVLLDVSPASGRRRRS